MVYEIFVILVSKYLGLMDDSGESVRDSAVFLVSVAPVSVLGFAITLYLSIRQSPCLFLLKRGEEKGRKIFQFLGVWRRAVEMSSGNMQRTSIHLHLFYAQEINWYFHACPFRLLCGPLSFHSVLLIYFVASHFDSLANKFLVILLLCSYGHT